MLGTTGTSDDLVAVSSDIAVGYRRHGQVLSDVNIGISKRRITGLLGPNGAGKSTLMRTLCRLLVPDSGNWQAPARTEIGVLIEAPGLHNWHTTAQELRYWAKVKGLGAQDIANAIEDAQLDSFVNKKIKHLSHGMRQRVGIAIAILGRPPLIVLDEPFNGLDPEQTDELLGCLHRLRHHGSAVLISTHLLGIATQCCDDVIVVAAGKVVDTFHLQDLANDVISVRYVDSETAYKVGQELGDNSVIAVRKSTAYIRAANIQQAEHLLKETRYAPVAISSGSELELRYREAVGE